MSIFRAAAVSIMVSVTSAAVLPATGAALTRVPPGNSAVNQYKEVLPGPGGGEVAGGSHRSPSETLGKRNAERLTQLGPEGRAAAELAAATAPLAASARNRNRQKKSGAKGNTPIGKADVGASGSTGLLEVLEQATGLSGAGETGPLLAVVFVATVIGAMAFVLLRRRALSG